MKYSKFAGVIRWSGGTMVMHVGMSADDEHPLVAERPDLWSDDQPRADLRHMSKSAPVIERATQAPGEVRRGPGRPPGSASNQPKAAA